MKVPTLPEFLAQDFPEEVIIGDGLLDQEGIMLVSGPTEVGKSYFGLQAALELATGQPFMGHWQVVRPCNVMLLQAEIGPKRFQRRVRKLSESFPMTDLLRATTVYNLKLDTPGGIKEFSTAIAAYDTEVVVFDPMRPFHEADENSSKEIDRLYGALKEEQADKHFAILWTHHERKPSAFSKGDKLEARGSTVITDRPDTVLKLTPTKDASVVKMTFEKVRNREEAEPYQPVMLRKDDVTGLFVVEGLPADIRADTIFEYISKETVSLGWLKKEIASRFHVTEKWVERTINQLEREGAVEKLPDPENRLKKLIKRGAKLQ